MHEEKKIEPSGLTGGLLEDVERAEAERIAPEEIAVLLEQYRGGDDEAGRRLQQGLRYLPYQFFIKVRPTVRHAAEDVLGTLFMEFGDCIERLRENDVSAERVAGYIYGDLKHSVTHYMAECSQRIKPKDSTNSERRKRGLEPYEGLSRRAAGQPLDHQDRDGNETVAIDHLNDPKNRRVMTPEDKIYRASKYGDFSDEPTFSRLLWESADSSLEHQILDGLCLGEKPDDLAEQIGISTSRVRKIMERLKARAIT